jgi:ABC-2 type transport system permease protein
MREASNDANARGTQLLAKYYTDHPELAPAGEKLDLNDFMARTASVQAEVEQTLAPLHAAFDAQLEAQQALVRRAAVLSPTIMAAELLPAFAGTGLERYQSFTKQVLAFHRAWQEALLPMVLRRERLSAAQVAALPQFRFVETPAATLARQAAPGIAWLLASAALVWAWAIWALRRFRLTG